MPKFYRITKNIFVLIPSSNIYSSANVNFIKDEKIALIDSGTINEPGPGRIRRIFESLGVASKIDLIILTHSHMDHMGGIGKLKKIFNPQILAHSQMELGNFEFWEFIEKMYPRFNKSNSLKYIINHIYGRSYGNSKFQLNRRLNEGDEINLGELNFKVIFTPGHSPDSICLYEPRKKILFSGDMIPYTPYIHTKISDFRESINKLLKLNVKLAIRGHGRPVLWSKEKERYIEFLKDMDVAKRRIIKILEIKGPQTAHQMANSVFQRTHLAHKTIYTNIMRVSVFWILKYLEELEHQNKVKSQLEKNKLIFSLK